MVEAALDFDGVGVPEPPVAARGKLAGVGAEVERLPAFGHRRLPRIDSDVEVRAAGSAERVKVAHADEGEQVEFDLAIVRGLDRVPQPDQVALPDELQLFRDPDPLDLVLPLRRSVEVEAAEELVAAGVE